MEPIGRPEASTLRAATGAASPQQVFNSVTLQFANIDNHDLALSGRDSHRMLSHTTLVGL